MEVVDPHASSKELQHEYGFGLTKKIVKGYDAVIVAVNHEQFTDLDDSYFRKFLKKDGIVVDVKGDLRKKIKQFNYWSL